MRLNALICDDLRNFTEKSADLEPLSRTIRQSRIEIHWFSVDLLTRNLALAVVLARFVCFIFFFVGKWEGAGWIGHNSYWFHLFIFAILVLIFAMNHLASISASTSSHPTSDSSSSSPSPPASPPITVRCSFLRSATVIRRKIWDYCDDRSVNRLCRSSKVWYQFDYQFYQLKDRYELHQFASVPGRVKPQIRRCIVDQLIEIPITVRELKLSSKFNRALVGTELPQNLTHLEFSQNFNQTVTNYPSTITHLSVSGNYKGEWPPNLTHLKFLSFHDDLPMFPHTITHLQFSASERFKNALNILSSFALPNSNEIPLQFSTRFSQSFQHVPASLIQIKFGELFNLSFEEEKMSDENDNNNRPHLIRAGLYVGLFCQHSHYGSTISYFVEMFEILNVDQEHGTFDGTVSAIRISNGQNLGQTKLKGQCNKNGDFKFSTTVTADTNGLATGIYSGKVTKNGEELYNGRWLTRQSDLPDGLFLMKRIRPPL